MQPIFYLNNLRHDKNDDDEELQARQRWRNWNQQNVSHVFVRPSFWIFAEKFNSNSFCVTLGDKNDKNTCFVKAPNLLSGVWCCALDTVRTQCASVGRNSIEIKQ